MDDQHVVLASVRDVVDEMVRDVDDGVQWDEDTRDEHVRRLASVLANAQDPKA